MLADRELAKEVKSFTNGMARDASPMRNEYCSMVPMARLYPHFPPKFVLVLNEMVLVLVLDCARQASTSTVLRTEDEYEYENTCIYLDDVFKCGSKTESHCWDHTQRSSQCSKVSPMQLADSEHLPKKY